MRASSLGWRWLVAGLLIVLEVCWVCQTGWGQNCLGETETNDAVELSDIGGVVPERACFEGEIVEGNEDYFSFELDASVWVAVGTLLEGGGDSTLTLFDEAGAELGFSDDVSGGWPESLIQGCLAPGRYHVVVGAFDGQESFKYRLMIEVLRPCEAELLPECRFEEQEPNETFERANFGAELPEEYCFRASIRPGDLVDSFGLDITTAHTVALTTIPQTGGNTVLMLFDESGAEIAFNDDNPTGGWGSLLEMCLEPGRYFAAVWSYDPSLLFEYILRIEHRAACGPASTSSGGG